MKYFLAKTDPESYSVDQFEAEHRTIWDGVRNAQALRAIREMHAGDRVFIYHSLKGDAGIVGLAKVVSEPRADSTDPKLTVVEFEFLTRLDPATTLKEIKASGLFNDWALVRQSRLSTMLAPDAFVGWMRAKHGSLHFPEV
ncbi:MAG: EVE domain-containing protein [Acidobacteriota bacterium]|nr:EVE domain-containing protein [Acidobacteriota bacterium]